MSHFGSDLKADGHGEVWLDLRPETKFKQYGWRCTTKEDAYCNKTLIGNWNQERYDLRKLEERKPMPSQYAHYYETSYNAEYLRNSSSAGRQAWQETKREMRVGHGEAQVSQASVTSPLAGERPLSPAGSLHKEKVFKKEPHVFPGHQPELIPPQYRPQQKSCYMIDYDSSQPSP